VNDEPVDALAMIVHRSPPKSAGRAVRAAQGADPPPDVQDRHSGRDRRENHRPRGYLGAAERRDREMLRRRHHAERKLLEKQKKGKAKMRQYGRVEIPQSAFINALKMGDEK
jgi:GTP-binding protein LepA